jgi:hypothetical protein
MRRFLPAVLLAAAFAGARAAPPAAPTAGEIRALVAKLGADDYAEREAAGKKLDEIGAPALDELRAATRSENPEVARRARDVLRRIERRVENEKTLAPTLVALDAKDRRLDDVLAVLSKRADCSVVLGGSAQAELADRKVSLSTGGTVPFWEAVLTVCDAADVQVASAGGFLAPDSAPYLGRAPRGVRVEANTQKAVVLEARGGAKRRPAAVFGAVLVEAVPFPKGSAGPAALLQAWPEPRLEQLTVRGVRVAAATDPGGGTLASDPAAHLVAPAGPTKSIRPDGVVVIRNRDGTATLRRDGAADTGAFRPNARQAVVGFKPGGAPPLAARELSVSVLGTVRSGVEPLARAALEENRPATADGAGGVELTVRTFKTADGKLGASVTVGYDRGSVEAAGVGVELPGVKGGGNHAVHGVRITDAAGRPYTLGLVGGSSRPGRLGRQEVTLSLELHPPKDAGPPDAATFWGTYAKPVEVPVVLKDVPLGGAK